MDEERWVFVFRHGVSPCLSDDALQALGEALFNDDPRLVQGMTVCPPPLTVFEQFPPEGGCALGYAGWQGDGLNTVQEVAEFVGEVCSTCDATIGEVGGCRWLLRWFDETPRDEMRTALLGEVRLEQMRRRERAAMAVN